jgi:hypothetical protein
VSEGAGIPNSETVRRFDLYFEGFTVNLSHPLDFSEGHSVSVVQTMLLLLMKTNQCLLLLGNSSDMDGFALFSSGIEYSVVLSEINESVSV